MVCTYDGIVCVLCTYVSWKKRDAGLPLNFQERKSLTFQVIEFLSARKLGT